MPLRRLRPLASELPSSVDCNQLWVHRLPDDAAPCTRVQQESTHAILCNTSRLRSCARAHAALVVDEQATRGQLWRQMTACSVPSGFARNQATASHSMVWQQSWHLETTHLAATRSSSGERPDGTRVC